MSEKSEKSLWAQYKLSKDETLLEELLECYRPLLAMYIYTFRDSGVPEQELMDEARRLFRVTVDKYSPKDGRLTPHLALELKKMTRFVNAKTGTPDRCS